MVQKLQKLYAECFAVYPTLVAHQQSKADTQTNRESLQKNLLLLRRLL